MHFRAHCSLLAAMTCATATLVGCTGKLNDLDGPFGDDLPALRGTTASATQRVDAPSISDEDAPWSSRASWTPVKVVVPTASVETQSAYRTRVSSRLATDPTQVVTAQAHAAIDLVLLAPRMIEVAPGTTVRAPSAETQVKSHAGSPEAPAAKDASR
jgi:hypothetical protein